MHTTVIWAGLLALAAAGFFLAAIFRGGLPPVRAALLLNGGALVGASALVLAGG